MEPLSIEKVSRAYQEGRMSPVSVMKELLEKIDRLDSYLNSYVELFSRSALDMARKAEEEMRSGHYRGPLHGIPLAVKDVIEVRGTNTTAGSRSLLNNLAASDAQVTRLLKESGAILIGKNSCYELALGPGTDGLFKQTRNPWDLRRTTWGSSSGSAAAVAAGLALAAIGTDTRGSIRAPASACGVVGFKPSFGRVSRQGVVPLSSMLDHVGPIAREALDCALILDAIEGQDPADPGTTVHPRLDIPLIRGCDVSDLIVGVSASVFDEPVHSAFMAAFNRAIDTFSQAGIDIVEVDDRSLVDAARASSATIVNVEAFRQYGHLLQSAGDGQIGEHVRARLQDGAQVSASVYASALETRNDAKTAFDETMADVDVLITLTTTDPPPLIEDESSGVKGNRELFNLVGAPAISVPCGFTHAGLPIGLQLAGRPGQDQSVLLSAQWYQQETGYRSRQPELTDG